MRNLTPVRRHVCPPGPATKQAPALASRLAAGLIFRRLVTGLATSLTASLITLTAGAALQPATATRISGSTPRPGLTTNGMTFKQAMDVGYAASRQGDFNTALINFQRAILIRPGHPYATAAADNMAYYIQHERVTTRQRAISQLESRLTTAQAQKDWVCAATTLDELTTYTEPGSLNRERLIGQRGEVSGLLDARIDHERWSTVCAAQNPVH